VIEQEIKFELASRGDSDGSDIQGAAVYVKPVEVVATPSIHRLCSWRSVRGPWTRDRLSLRGGDESERIHGS